MKHLKYASIGSPWSIPPRGSSQILVIYPKMGQKKPKRSKTAKSSQKSDFAHQNSPLRKCFFHLFSCPSSRPVRAGRFAPLNFDRGLKTRISSDDRQGIKNDYLQSKKLKNGAFCTLKFGLFNFFSHPSSRPIR